MRILALLRDRRFCPLLVVQMSAVFNAGLLVTSSINVDVTLLQVFGIFIVALLVSGVAGQVVDKYENDPAVANRQGVRGSGRRPCLPRPRYAKRRARDVRARSSHRAACSLMHARHVLLSRLMAEDELVGGNTLLVAGAPCRSLVAYFPSCSLVMVSGALCPGYSLSAWPQPWSATWQAASFRRAGRQTLARRSAGPLTWLVRNGLAHGVGRTSLFALFGVAWFWLSSMLLFAQLWRLLGPSPVRSRSLSSSPLLRSAA